MVWHSRKFPPTPRAQRRRTRDQAGPAGSRPRPAHARGAGSPRAPRRRRPAGGRAAPPGHRRRSPRPPDRLGPGGSWSSTSSACSAAPSRWKPHGRRPRRRRGGPPTTSAQVICTDFAPGRAATGSPPAARTRSGTQCPARERRVDPLDDRHPWPGPAGHRLRDAESRCRRAATSSSARSSDPGSATDVEDRAEHLVERVRVERDDVGPAAEVVERLRRPGRWAGRRPGTGPGSGSAPGPARPAPRRAGCRGRRRPPSAPARRRRSRPASGRRCRGRRRRPPSRPARVSRLVALEGDPDQLVAEAERVDDLGRRGQQRDDPHQQHLEAGLGRQQRRQLDQLGLGRSSRRTGRAGR